MKAIKIDSCKNCWYRWISSGKSVCSQIEKNRDIKDIFVIPEWCPLPDMQESDDEIFSKVCPKCYHLPPICKCQQD